MSALTIARSYSLDPYRNPSFSYIALDHDAIRRKRREILDLLVVYAWVPYNPQQAKEIQEIMTCVSLYLRKKNIPLDIRKIIIGHIKAKHRYEITLNRLVWDVNQLARNRRVVSNKAHNVFTDVDNIKREYGPTIFENILHRTYNQPVIHAADNRSMARRTVQDIVLPKLLMAAGGIFTIWLIKKYLQEHAKKEEASESSKKVPSEELEKNELTVSEIS